MAAEDLFHTLDGVDLRDTKVILCEQYARIKELEEWQRRAVEVLKYLEYSSDNLRCHICYADNFDDKNKHEPDCKLMALLSTEPTPASEEAT